MTISNTSTATARASFNLQSVIHSFGPLLILLVLMAIAASMSSVQVFHVFIVKALSHCAAVIGKSFTMAVGIGEALLQTADVG